MESVILSACLCPDKYGDGKLPKSSSDVKMIDYNRIHSVTVF